MSGIFARSKYDNCAGIQKVSDSCYPGNWFINEDSYINPSFKKNTDIPCGHHEKDIGCAACNLNQVTDTVHVINLGHESFVKRAEIEDNLYGTRRNLSQCASEQYPACELTGAKHIHEECVNYVTLNPKLCERSIVPTNMKFPTSKGFN
jgi:hypothetical protein